MARDNLKSPAHVRTLAAQKGFYLWRQARHAEQMGVRLYNVARDGALVAGFDSQEEVLAFIQEAQAVPLVERMAA